jgi:hypothetical protein
MLRTSAFEGSFSTKKIRLAGRLEPVLPVVSLVVVPLVVAVVVVLVVELVVDVVPPVVVDVPPPPPPPPHPMSTTKRLSSAKAPMGP